MSAVSIAGRLLRHDHHRHGGLGTDGLRLAAQAAGAVGVPAIVPRGDLPLVRDVNQHARETRQRVSGLGARGGALGLVGAVGHGRGRAVGGQPLQGHEIPRAVAQKWAAFDCRKFVRTSGRPKCRSRRVLPCAVKNGELREQSVRKDVRAPLGEASLSDPRRGAACPLSLHRRVVQSASSTLSTRRAGL